MFCKKLQRTDSFLKRKSNKIAFQAKDNSISTIISERNNKLFTDRNVDENAVGIMYTIGKKYAIAVCTEQDKNVFIKVSNYSL